MPLALSDMIQNYRSLVRGLLESLGNCVCVSTANMYPQITLTGSYGLQAVTGGDLFSSGAAIWSLGAGLLQPIFRGGELTARRRAAIAVYDQAVAQYRDTVLQAFQNVADVLRALAGDASTLKAQAEAEAAARDALDLTEKQFQLGAVSYLSLLNAERQYEQARLGLVQAQAARFADTAALYQALGGGWWNRSPQAEAAAAAKAE
jgi:outer membrane protein TolC